VRPDKLLGNGILWDGSEFVEEWPSLEVEIQAVAKAKLLLALEGVSINAERVFQGATTLLVACHDLFADFLGKAESEIAVLDLLLLRREIFKGNLILTFHDNF
jgi:hypothetical protein